MQNRLLMLQAAPKIFFILIILHQEDLHEIIEVSVKHPLGVRSLVSGTKILDHLIRMQDIAADL